MKIQLLKHRRKLVIVFHALVFVLAYWLAYALRFDFQIPPHYTSLLFVTLPIILAIKLFIFDRFDLYQGWWRYVGMSDLTEIFKASVVSGVAVMILGLYVFHNFNFPRSIPILDFILGMGLLGGSRFGIRALREGQLNFLTGLHHGDGEGRTVLIIGAGDAGESLAREIRSRPDLNYQVVGFLDDMTYKRGVVIHGYRVLGGIAEVKEICESYEVDEIVIAIPSITGAQMQRVVKLCEATGRKVKTIPGVDQLIDGQVTVSQLREVDIEDLLGREPVHLDKHAIGLYLNRKKVLVTGAAGSIGSEICRQVLAFSPRELILVDHYENGIFEMGRELSAATARADIRYFVGDVTDRNRMLAIFQETRPEVVFHAAAYKHVPVMEENPGEAIKNNVGGTSTLAGLCDSLQNVERFVMISTDKAINPTSIMGASKRIAERYVQKLSATSPTKFITVRFGNVLGSAGSVIPIFKDQIARGGPVTVTHPEMIRYFMTIPEAAQLVLQAGAMGRGGEIFVLNMGKPVRIVDLAESLIKLSGLKPHEDIKIEFTGIRPGEKLYEELYLDNEHVAGTDHPKIFIRKSFDQYPPDFLEKISRLLDFAAQERNRGIRPLIAELVPEYQGQKDAPAALRKKTAPASFAPQPSSPPPFDQPSPQPDSSAPANPKLRPPS